MKYTSFLLLVLLVVSFSDINAQRRPPVRRPATRPSSSRTPTRTTPAPVTQPTTVQTSNSNKPSAPYITIATSGGNGGGINDTAKISQRNDNIITRNYVKDRTPLAYKNIREDDAVYKQRIWREIDAREKENLPFRYSLVEDNGSQRFISILLSAIRSGVTAFDADIDDRFTTPLTTEQALGKLAAGKPDTSAVNDLDGNIIRYEIRSKEVMLDSVYKYRIKEEVVFDKETSVMYTRILGIAPEMPKYTSEGTFISLQTLFWLYYPDLRTTLAKYEVYNPKNFGARMSWEDLFESRMFSSYITKSTLDNPFDQSLKTKYGKNTLFALLEGDAIKEKIFNYEQSLWSY